MDDIKIGTKFKTRGVGFPRFCEVVDILKTYDHEGNLVKTRYVATHYFAGQLVRETDILRTTIAKGMVL